jgi:hypothetical protein
VESSGINPLFLSENRMSIILPIDSNRQGVFTPVAKERSSHKASRLEKEKNAEPFLSFLRIYYVNE